MQDFTKLTLWQKAHGLALDVYRSTAFFPRDERYGLTNQIRRSATSIATNIAEGCGRNSGADFAWFLSIAGGSASELEYQILLSRELGFIASDAHALLTNQTGEVKKMISGLLRKLKTDD